MSFSELDVEEQINFFRQMKEVWNRIEKGNLYITTHDKETLITVAFAVEHFRVFISGIVGPRGGVTEEVVVIDDRAKDTEIDHLVYVQSAQISSVYSDGFVLDTMFLVPRVKLNREEKIIAISRILMEECRKALDDPTAYSRKIIAREKNTTNFSPTFFLKGGLPRT